MKQKTELERIANAEAGKSLEFCKTQVRNYGNLIVMGDGDKQLLLSYSFSLEPTGFANGYTWDVGEKRELHHLLNKLGGWVFDGCEKIL